MVSLPYITSAGNIEKAFRGIKDAPVPERISQDFVKTILKIPGGSGAQMNSFLKKINFSTPDGRPTELYKRYRNPTTSGRAVADANRYAYKPLYQRNEYMHQLTDSELLGLIVEVTGQPHDSNPVKLSYSSIRALMRHADFNGNDNSDLEEDIGPIIKRGVPDNSTKDADNIAGAMSVGLNLGYTINLNLPATSDQEVFNAIFKSLKAHLLSGDDA
ncbi:DUF5343 domain-containing protein [Breoghania sp.]|uniref:DUF5343 domain-containing protein n=1 Tax=Breoghania sp. TaxID=2065378 RepID=UPI0029C9C4F3|nr:DUF5343 domain-containing protein [Breoghania sp.]